MVIALPQIHQALRWWLRALNGAQPSQSLATRLRLQAQLCRPSDDLIPTAVQHIKDFSSANATCMVKKVIPL